MQASGSARSDGGFVSLIESDGQLTLFGALAALGLALVFGMLHALTPGHGKTMVAAYLAGTRGQARHALILGGTVTVTHTAGVFALGIVTLSLSQFIVPEQLYPWLNLASGVMVVEHRGVRDPRPAAPLAAARTARAASSGAADGARRTTMATTTRQPRRRPRSRATTMAMTTAMATPMPCPTSSRCGR